MRHIRKHSSARLLVAALVVGIGLFAATAGSSPAGIAGTNGTGGPQITHGAPVKPVVFDGDLRTLSRGAPKAKAFRPYELETPLSVKQPPPGAATPSQQSLPTTVTSPAPDPILSFKGLDKATWGSGFPPDTVGDVGPTVFVQAVNTSIGIFRKSDGLMLAATTFDDLWSGTATACDANNQGDPTVVYDPQADRWIVADFAFSGGGTTPPFYECIAVSKTGDPVSGGWFLYPIRTDDVNHPFLADYPKMGIWPDGLYMTANMFSTGFEEARVWAFNRGDLESGAAVRSVIVDLGTPDFFTLLPSNMRSVTGAPPASSPNYVVAESSTSFAFDVWKFHADFSGGGSTFAGPTEVDQDFYASPPLTVPTPANSLDTLQDRMMMQAQYTKISGTESVWVNHTVSCCGFGSSAGIQWSQINVTGGTINTTPVQQEIFPSSDDGLNRWMGSLAVDMNGDMGLGYSVANGSTNPDIRYAARLSTDPLGTLPLTETSMLQGVTRGTQEGDCGGVTCTRWGENSAMLLDPDGCTFWYTQEYYEATGLDWQTRVGAFTLPTCKTSQKITFGPLLDKTFGEADFSVSATADSHLDVLFAARGNCTVTVSLVHITGAGSCTITAWQPGNETYARAQNVVRTFSIAKADQTIAFPAISGKTFGAADFTVSATATSALPVSFAASGNCTVSGATVHLTGAGPCTVTASQPGDANYFAATPVSQAFSIAKADQTIAFPAIAGKTFGDVDFTVSATASSGLPVSFAAGGSCTVSGATVHITGAGTCTLTASQAGNGNVNAASATQSVAVGKANQTITFGPLADRTLSAPDFIVSATASSGLSVSFAASGSCSVSGTTVHLTTVGSCTVTASQPGDANYTAATSVSRSFAVTRPVTPPKCTVPKVVGKTLTGAKTALKARHCRTGKVSYAYSSKIKKGRVSSQSRRAGQVLPVNTKVNLVVSRGKKPVRGRKPVHG